MNSVSTLKEKFKSYLEVLEGMLEDEAKYFNIPVYLIKGKRLRAIISHISGRIYDHPIEKTLITGYSLEMIHAASLIHDDIIDESETRRGGKTLNKILTTSLSVLIGDVLFTKALVKVSSFPKFFSILSNVVYNMALGQYEEDSLSVELMDEHTYLDIIYKKTATLYEIAFETGKLLKGEEDHTLREAGKMFGMAFQILDDCDDYLEDEGKPTLPYIYQRLGYENPLHWAKMKAGYYLRGAEWNLHRIGVFEHFADVFSYMWSRL